MEPTVLTAKEILLGKAKACDASAESQDAEAKAMEQAAEYHRDAAERLRATAANCRAAAEQLAEQEPVAAYDGAGNPIEPKVPA